MSYFVTQGKLEYFTNWCVLWLDPEIIRYYRSLVPKARQVQPPMYPTHISVVRLFEVYNPTNWKKHEGLQIDIVYGGVIYNDDTYYWLNAWSDDIGDIREELGLNRIRQPYDSYHITIGNTK